jgi:hypothetical protein
MGSGVTMFDIMADDLDRARQFYQTAFGWKTKQVPGAPAITRALPGQPKSAYPFVEAIPGPIADHGFLVDRGAISGHLSERTSGFNSPSSFSKCEISMSHWPSPSASEDGSFIPRSNTGTSEASPTWPTPRETYSASGRT